MKTIRIYSFLYIILSSGYKTMKTIRMYSFLYTIISSWDKTITTIRIYNYLYNIISALARAHAPWDGLTALKGTSLALDIFHT